MRKFKKNKKPKVDERILASFKSNSSKQPETEIKVVKEKQKCQSVCVVEKMKQNKFEFDPTTDAS